MGGSAEVARSEQRRSLSAGASSERTLDSSSGISEKAGAIVLVGGRSARMGQPKAALDFGGMPLLTRIVIELDGGSTKS